MNDSDLFLRAFRFEIKLRRSPDEQSGLSPTGETNVAAESEDGDALSDGAFQEVSGLEVELDVTEYLEGGRNDGAIRQVGRAKYSPIVLKRGMFYSYGELNKELWSWLQSIAAGTRPIPRYDGVIEVWGKDQSEVVATWEFERGV